MLVVLVLVLVLVLGYHSGKKQAVAIVHSAIPSATKPVAPVYVPTNDNKLQFLPMQLTGQEEKAYQELKKAIWDMEPSVTIYNLSYKQLLNFEKLLFQSPELFWMKSPVWFVEQEEGYQLFFEFSMTKGERDAALKSIDKVTEDIFSQMPTDNLEGIIKSSCKWLQQNTVYALENGQPSNSLASQTILGPFLKNEGICSGYAKSLAYLIGKAGYPVGYCTGWYNDTYHAWVAIKSGKDVLFIDPTACVTINAPPVPVKELGSKYMLELLDWYIPAHQH